jgi:hypothetical protein
MVGVKVVERGMRSEVLVLGEAAWEGLSEDAMGGESM